MKKIALMHEWFTALAGSEKVVEQFCAIYPQADLFAVYADPKVVQNTDYLRNRKLQTTFIQNLPRAAKSYRSYLPFMPLAVEQLDMSPYDVVISSSHAVAKGVLTGPDQLHISYVHSPIRYAWDLQHQYLRESGMSTGAKGWLAKYLLHKMRIWDVRTVNGVDHFVANSHFIARRIRKAYGRDADVIYPPVDIEAFQPVGKKDDFYLTASRLVPYKKMDLIVEAFASMPNKRLVVIGDGPDMIKLKQKAKSNVEILGYQPFDTLRDMMQRARAFVFAAEEDFGIIPVEAQACGTPVIAFGKGGVRETIIAGGPAPTGVFFYEQTVAALCAAVDEFERDIHKFTPEACRKNSERFSVERFKEEFKQYAEDKWELFEAKVA